MKLCIVMAAASPVRMAACEAARYWLGSSRFMWALEKRLQDTIYGAREGM